MALFTSACKCNRISSQSFSFPLQVAIWLEGDIDISSVLNSLGLPTPTRTSCFCQQKSPCPDLNLKESPKFTGKHCQRHNGPESFKISPELQVQNLDQSAQSLSKSLALWPNLSFQICNKLLPAWSSSSTSATVTTSISFELATSHARVTSIKFTKRYGVSQSVS